MAAVSAPGYPYLAPPPPAPPARPRRRWPLVLVAAWIVVLGGLAFWSVRHSPPTVPDQRSIAQALPVLQRAAGALAAAADGPDRVVVLGPVRLDPGCRITPIRHGVEGTRAVTVTVQAGGANKALSEIAAALPPGYGATVRTSNAGRLLGLEADAGGYVAVDARTPANAQSFTLEASTGCRPAADTAHVAPDPVAPGPPGALTAALRVLAPTTDPVIPRVVSLSCPTGTAAGTYTVDNLPAPRDLGLALQPAVTGATVIRSDPDDWAYRVGRASVVVSEDGGRVSVEATTDCP
jgi:hypothetical protein